MGVGQWTVGDESLSLVGVHGRVEGWLWWLKDVDVM